MRLEDIEDTDIIELFEFDFLKNMSLVNEIYEQDTTLLEELPDNYPSKSELSLRLLRLPVPAQYVNHLMSYGSRLYIATFIGRYVGYINIQIDLNTEEPDSTVFRTVRIVSKGYKGIDFSELMAKKFDQIIIDDQTLDLADFSERLNAYGHRYAFLTEYEFCKREEHNHRRAGDDETS